MVFTGLVKTVGRAVFDPTTNVIHIGIFEDGNPVPEFWSSELKGASIAVNGCCLTLLEVPSNHIGSFFMMAETRNRVNLVDVQSLDKDTSVEEHLRNGGTEVNVEPAMRMGDPYGGHMVTGHVDSIQEVIAIDRCTDGSMDVWISIPAKCEVVHKGSIIIDGVSLTVAELDRKRQMLRVSVIPHTQHATTIHSLKIAQRVNVEFDQTLKLASQLTSSTSDSTLESDEFYMRRAIALGRRGQCTAAPNPAVGCVIVDAKGNVIGEGYHEKAGQGHGEVQALQDVFRKFGEEEGVNKLKGTTAYVTLEPCSHTGRTGPCMLQLIKYQFARVVVGILDPDPLVAGKGIAGLREAGITVDVGVLDKECREYLKAYLKHRNTGRPWVVWKAAITIDGKIADLYWDSQWISNEESRKDVHLRWRATSQAIVVGSRTAAVDNPQLTVREYPEYVNPELVTPPLRVVVGKSIELRSHLCDTTVAPTLIFTTSDSEADTVKSQVTEVVTVGLDSEGEVDFDAVLVELGKRGVLQVLVEGGAQLGSSLLHNGHIDQLVIYQAPIFLPQGQSLFIDKDPVSLKDAHQQSMHLLRTTLFGSDLCLEYTKEKFC